MNFPTDILFEFSSHNFDEEPIFGRKTNFCNLKNIPDCSLFKFTNEPLKFISDPVNEGFEIIEVPIRAALDLLDDKAYELHSERWFKVRKQFSLENETHFPWIFINSDGEVQLMDGRHRLVAMMLFKNMEFAPVQVEPSMLAQVKKYFDEVLQQYRPKYS
ncbi:TPA: hypothetical protein MW242_003032 [Acinetobacter baumannii]|nr:hypothetical protein [Acinetobacter baumannii]